MAVAELATNAFLAFCADPKHARAAAPAAAAYAKSFGEMVLVNGLDPQRAITVLEAAWQHRDLAGYRACELALTLADARRVGEDYAGVQIALDHYARLRDTPAWKEWQEHSLKAAMLPIHDLQHECRRAMLESFLGNPDGVLHHLRRAASMLEWREAEVPPSLRAVIEGARLDAELALLRDRIECYCNLEQFGRAASVAAEAVRRTRGLGAIETHFRLCLALAQSWDPASSAAEHAAAERALETMARDPNAAVRKPALRRLLRLAMLREDPKEAARYLEQLEALGGRLSPGDTSLQTELLLRQDATAPCSRDQLRAQLTAQSTAFADLLASWQRTPHRAGGSGFLHYLDRREAIGQLIAITLRAAAKTGEAPPEAAVAEALGHVLATQTHSTLAQRLATTPPSVADLMASLAPGHGIVLYLPTRAVSHVFVVERGGVSHHLLGRGAVAIRTDLEPFLAALGDATNRIDHAPQRARDLAARLRELGATLAQTLVPPAVRARLATWSALTVIGSELLHGAPSGSADAGLANYLPIECLPWGEKTTFGERFAIDHNTSLPVWRQLGQRVGPAGPQSQLRLFGCLRPTDGAHEAAGPIADGDRLGPALAKVGAVFERRNLHLDEQCSLTRLAPKGAKPEQRRTAPSLAVFVAHGGYDANLERGAFLQFHDGRLACAAAEDLGTPEQPFADIVVLAACRAAKGPTRAGDSFANLGGAFLLAGATTIVQSRFDLPLHGTRAVLDELLQRLARGESCAAALRAARCAAQQGGADPLAPYRTGVLQVHGYGQAPLRR